MLEKKILEDYQQALKSKDALKASILSFLRAELNNFAIEKRKKELEDIDIFTVIKRLVKQHQDSIEQFQKGQREDLVKKEKGELEILESYLPKQLEPEKIKQVIEEIITATGATTIKDMGKVIKEVMAKIGASADAKSVSDLVKMRLTNAAKE